MFTASDLRKMLASFESVVKHPWLLTTRLHWFCVAATNEEGDAVMFDQQVIVPDGGMDVGTGEVVFGLDDAARAVGFQVRVIAKANSFIENQTFVALFQNALTLITFRVSEKSTQF